MQDLSREEMLDVMRDLLLVAKLLKSYIDVQPEHNVMHQGNNMPFCRTAIYADLAERIESAERIIMPCEGSQSKC